MRALNPSRRLKIFHAKFNVYETMKINAKPENFNELLYDFVRSITVIQIDYQTRHLYI
jgi:hypothetical protein